MGGGEGKKTFPKRFGWHGKEGVPLFDAAKPRARNPPGELPPGQGKKGLSFKPGKASETRGGSVMDRLFRGKE